MRKLTLFVIVMLCYCSNAIAEQRDPEACTFESLEYSHSINEVSEASIDVILSTTIVKNSIEGCGELHLELLSFQGDRHAKTLNRIINKITPPNLLVVKTHPEKAKAILKKKVKKDYQIDYYLIQKMDWLTEKWVSFSQENYVYTGGAHGATTIEKATFDLETGKEINLSDILSDQKIDDILLIARKELIKNYNLDSGKSWEEQGLWISPSKKSTDYPWVGSDGFYLPNDFNLNKEGITFIFQQYEIAPYSMGLMTFTLSWEQLKPFLKINIPVHDK